MSQSYFIISDDIHIYLYQRNISIVSGYERIIPNRCNDIKDI